MSILSTTYYFRNLLLSAAGESKQRNLYVDPDGTVQVSLILNVCISLSSIMHVQWKEMYSERFRLRRNWLKGYCTVRTFEGHTQGQLRMHMGSSSMHVYNT